MRKIDLHPDLFSESRWERLAASVLYHEYLHALGFRHCPTFRKLESLWPDVEARLGTRKVKIKFSNVQPLAATKKKYLKNL